MKIRLYQDSSDIHYHQKYGSVPRVDLEDANYDNPSFPEKIQAPGNVQCTLYTVSYLTANRFGFDVDDIDFDEFWGNIPHNIFGAIPNDVLGRAIKVGFKLKSTGEYIKPFKSYWRADTGPYDYFDNTRSAMRKAKSPCAIWSPWFYEWLSLKQNDVMPIGKTITNNHMYVLKGWGTIKEITVNGESMFEVEWWGGFTTRMPRETFNWLMDKWGTGTAILLDEELDAEIVKDLWHKIYDLYRNILLIIQDQIHQLKNKATDTTQPKIVQPEPVKEVKKRPEIVKRDLLTEFCKAIADFEGKPGDLSYRNCNPGNIRGIDGKFLKFKTWDIGFQYLKDYVTRACTGKHRAYKPDFTIKQFFAVYAPSADNNDPENYAKWVCKRLNIPTDTKIKTLVS